MDRLISSGAGMPHDQNTFLQEHLAQPVSMSMAGLFFVCRVTTKHVALFLNRRAYVCSAFSQQGWG